MTKTVRKRIDNKSFASFEPKITSHLCKTDNFPFNSQRQKKEENVSFAWE